MINHGTRCRQSADKWAVPLRESFLELTNGEFGSVIGSEQMWSIEVMAYVTLS